MGKKTLQLSTRWLVGTLQEGAVARFLVTLGLPPDARILTARLMSPGIFGDTLLFDVESATWPEVPSGGVLDLYPPLIPSFDQVPAVPGTAYGLVDGAEHILRRLAAGERLVRDADTQNWRLLAPGERLYDGTPADVLGARQLEALALIWRYYQTPVSGIDEWALTDEGKNVARSLA